MAGELTHQNAGRHASAKTAAGLVRAAAEANLRCRYRKGALIEPPGRGDIMISGDLHGSLVNFRAIVRMADLFNHPHRHLVVQELVHQDNLPRSETACRSYRLVEMAARLKTMFPHRFHLIFGNHEFAELNDMAIGKRGRVLNELFAEGLRRAYAERWSDVNAAYKEFWRTLPLAVRGVHGLFVSHSIPSKRYLAEITYEYLSALAPGQDLARGKPPFRMLWGRDLSPETAEAFARQARAELLILAHTPCENGYSLPTPRHVVLDSSGPRACCLLLPLDRPVNQQAALAGIRRLAGHNEETSRSSP